VVDAGNFEPDWPSAPQKLDVFLIHAQGLFQKEDNRVKGLIFSAGRDIVIAQSSREPIGLCE
jgi:hypothetical protein